MSQWTHVNASFRVDGVLKYLTNKEIEKVIGKPYLWEDDYDDFFDSNDNPKFKLLPRGSEGSLEYSVWNNPDDQCLALQTITVFGDLRDYSNVDELEIWFRNVCKYLYIRQSVIQITVEHKKNVIIGYDGCKFMKQIF